MASSRPLQNAIYPAPGFNEDEKRSFWPADVEVAAPYLSDHCFYFVHDEDYLSLKSFDWKGRLEKAGAKISNSYNDKVTVVVVKYRDSPEYIRACRDGKIVATMWWVSNTLMRQRYESPTRRLLDYPVPRGGIPGMENEVIVIAGYEGIALEYVRHLVHRCGCKLNPVIDSSVKLLITSSDATATFKEARKEYLPTVNHLWLEHCYQRWEKVVISSEATYTFFFGEAFINSILADTELISKDLENWWKEGLETSAQVDRNRDNVTPSSSAKQGKPSKIATPTATPSTTTVSQPRQTSSKAVSQLVDTIIPEMNKDQQCGYSMAGEEMSDEPSKEEEDDKRKDDEESTVMDIDNNKATGSKRRLQPESSESNSTQKKKRKLDSLKGLLSDAESTQQVNTSSTSKTIKIATSSIDLDTSEKKGILGLGGQMVENVTQATHLLVEKALRTPKFLCAINLGLTIVHRQWLRKCIEEHTWLDASEFVVQDKVMEKKYHFNLKESLSIAKRKVVPGKHPHGTWLSGFEVYVLQSNKAEALESIIETAGGKLIKRLTRKPLQDLLHPQCKRKLLVVSDPKEKSKWGDYSKLSVPIYDVELIIIGALSQKLDVDVFRLA